MFRDAVSIFKLGLTSMMTCPLNQVCSLPCYPASYLYSLSCLFLRSHAVAVAETELKIFRETCLMHPHTVAPAFICTLDMHETLHYTVLTCNLPWFLSLFLTKSPRTAHFYRCGPAEERECAIYPSSTLSKREELPGCSRPGITVTHTSVETTSTISRQRWRGARSPCARLELCAGPSTK